MEQPGREPVELGAAGVSEGFLSSLGVPLLAGRGFNAREIRPYGSGPPSGVVLPVILNSSAAGRLGFPRAEAAVGARLSFTGADLWTGEVVGVTPDFPLGQLRSEEPLPAVLTPSTGDARFLVAALEPGQGADAAARLDEVVRSFRPDRPVERYFLVDRIAAAYVDVTRLFGLVTFFAGLSAAAAARGMVGISLAMSERMKRETGVRKAFGAQGSAIGRLFLKRLAPLVLAGAVVGAGAASWIGWRWVQRFPDHIELSLAPAFIATGMILVLGLAAAGVQTVRLARTRPITALR